MTSILIVDDDPVIRHSLTETLQDHGFDVCTAIHGIDAAKQLKTTKVDVVFLDIFMPEKDGFETLADIHRFDKNIKVIAISAESKGDFQPLTYARSLGADATLAKPFSVDELLSVLQEVLGSVA
jgi:DNA-binding response OmpR family regulator